MIMRKEEQQQEVDQLLLLLCFFVFPSVFLLIPSSLSPFPLSLSLFSAFLFLPCCLFVLVHLRWTTKLALLRSRLEWSILIVGLWLVSTGVLLYVYTTPADSSTCTFEDSPIALCSSLPDFLSFFLLSFFFLSRFFSLKTKSWRSGCKGSRPWRSGTRPSLSDGWRPLAANLP